MPVINNIKILTFLHSYTSRFLLEFEILGSFLSTLYYTILYYTTLLTRVPLVLYLTYPKAQGTRTTLHTLPYLPYLMDMLW